MEEIIEVRITDKASSGWRKRILFLLGKPTEWQLVGFRLPRIFHCFSLLYLFQLSLRSRPLNVSPSPLNQCYKWKPIILSILSLYHLSYISLSCTHTFVKTTFHPNFPDSAKKNYTFFLSRLDSLKSLWSNSLISHIQWVINDLLLQNVIHFYPFFFVLEA